MQAVAAMAACTETRAGKPRRRSSRRLLKRTRSVRATALEAGALVAVAPGSGAAQALARYETGAAPNPRQCRETCNEKAMRSGAVHMVLSKRFLREIGRKGGEVSNARSMRRKEAARHAANARWHVGTVAADDGTGSNHPTARDRKANAPQKWYFSTNRNSAGSFGKVATVLPDRRKNSKMPPNRQPAGVQPYI
jgi:general stress protein YciG